MTQRIFESATLTVDPTTKALRVCLISEGVGSSAVFKREFFTQANADALGGSLSFPKHPLDPQHPEHRDPMSAIGSIADSVKIEEHDGKMSFWSEFVPAKSRPDVGPYLEEFGHKLGLSVYGDSDGYNEGGKWVAESLDSSDPYRSVDLVVAAGRGGKFEKISESLGLLPKTPATAVEKEDNMELKDVADKVDRLTVVMENLVKELGDGKLAEAQVKANDDAVAKLTESRLADYAKAEGLITEAKLTQSQSDDLRALAITGADISAPLETAKKVLAEALALTAEITDEDGSKSKIAEGHLPSSTKQSTFDPSSAVPGFGQV